MKQLIQLANRIDRINTAAAKLSQLAVLLMIVTNTIHPPAGANPVIAIMGAESFEFVIMPVGIGAAFIVIFSFLYNKTMKRP